MYLYLFVIVISFFTGCLPNETSQSTKEVPTLLTQDENVTAVTATKTETCIEYSTQIMNGKTLYTQYCAACHNDDALTGLFPIRGATLEDIHQALLTVVNMVELNLAAKLDTQARTDISAYLVEMYTNPDVMHAGNCTSVDAFTTKAVLGSSLFFDQNLSRTNQTSCASCHNPSHAFIDARYLAMAHHPVQGALSLGDDNISLGGRNTPTILYAHFAPTRGQKEDGNYTGGQFHDGRADTLKDQAKGPFLDPAEMMMPDIDTVIERVKTNASYVTQFQALYGETIFDDHKQAFDAIAAFEHTELFAPFTSKYDRFKEGNYTMSEIEAQGYALFFSDTLSCKQCHSINGSTEKASHELFTNFHYENIGTPRNLAALLTRDGNTSHLDLGLGVVIDINDSRHYGKIKVPTLRNVAVTAPYMHNGVFQKLRTVLAFYDHMTGNGSHPLNPETNTSWEETDVPTTVHHALLRASVPLHDKDIEAIEAFLRLLTDAAYEPLLP